MNERKKKSGFKWKIINSNKDDDEKAEKYYYYMSKDTHMPDNDNDDCGPQNQDKNVKKSVIIFFVWNSIFFQIYLSILDLSI